MKKISRFNSCFSKALVLFCCISAQSASSVAQQNAEVKCANRFVQFSFNKVQGTYSIMDRRDNKTVIEGAAFQLNDDVSTDGYTYTSSIVSLKDEFGSGKKIILTGSKKERPSLVLEAFVYDDKSFVVLNNGIKNATSKEIRIMKFYPLKGRAYPGFAFDEYKTLDGESGTANTKVAVKDSAASRNNLLATFGKKGEAKRSLVTGGLSYHEFQKYASIIKAGDYLKVELRGDDPVGKLVDAGATYLLADKFYIDFSTDNRFEALEKYGAALAVANHSDVSGVTIPILNFWYCFIKKYGGNEFRDNSIGTVEEMEEIRKTGFLKYGPVGLRLEPDDYALPSNQQGWWDDKHWQMYKGGQLLAPYETIVKWGTKIRSMGGVPFIYGQTAKRSEDYSLAHPDHILFNNPYSKRSKGRVGWWGRSSDSTAIYWTYDFTDPGFIGHMKEVYQNLKAGTVQGIKFDYPETGWSYDGGFEDKYATTTSAYRNIFKLAYDGLGKGRDVQERIPPYGDVALGVITTQRTEGDNDRVYPTRVSKTGLRWYKNRMVSNYDCDPINPFHAYPTTTRDGWRAALTMTYTTSGRLEIGKYFEKMDSAMLFDLSRCVPLLAAPTVSARPVDAFAGRDYPQVYDFTIKSDWHIVTFTNTKIEGEVWPTDVGAYTSDVQFIPKKMLPDVVTVSLSDKTDDGGLGFNPQKKYYVFDFWNWRFVGRFEGNASLSQELRPGEARVLAVQEAKAVPQALSTSRHILQGYLDMATYPEWQAQSKTLAGTSKLIGGETYKLIVAGNGYTPKQCTAAAATCAINLVDKTAGIYEIAVTTAVNADVLWKIRFEK